MPTDTECFNALPQTDRYQIMQAVNTLCESNPDVVKQLTKLAEVKKQNGLVWNMLKSKCK